MHALPLLSGGGCSAGTTREIVDVAFNTLLGACGSSKDGMWWPTRSLSLSESAMFGTLMAYSFALLTPSPVPLGRAIYVVVCGLEMPTRPGDWKGLRACKKEISSLRGLVGSRSTIAFLRYFDKRRLERIYDPRGLLDNIAAPPGKPSIQDWVDLFVFEDSNRHFVFCLARALFDICEEHPNVVNRYAGGYRGLGGGIDLLFPRTTVIYAAVEHLVIGDRTLILPGTTVSLDAARRELLHETLQA
jgi:hypothetical protein